MNPVERLMKDLRSISSEASRDFDFGAGPVSVIKNEEKKIAAWLNSMSNTKPSDKSIMDAVLFFVKNHGFGDARNARLACWGAGIRSDAEKYSIMEDDRNFLLFLSSVDSYLVDPKSYRRCYRGLLAAYFGYDPDGNDSNATGRKNWGLLRRYLEKRIDYVSIPETVDPEWVHVITEHRNLLSDNPCERYGRGFLDGEQAELDLSASRWVSRAIFKARFSAAGECSDNEFITYLPKLFSTLEDRRYSGFLDRGLSIILDRYCSMPGSEIFPELMEFAIRHWGTPWQKHSDAKSSWELVSSGTLKRMTEWITLNLLKKFFELFSGDGPLNTRRYDFWARYSEKMGNIYFVLGREAIGDRRPVYMELKKRMKGRIISITDGLSSQNSNAVMIEIDGFCIVESGSSGAAAYIYRGFPFDPEKQGDITLSMIRNSSLTVDRLYHRDNTHGFARWESLFETHLESLCLISRTKK